jgi:uncharacterized membrane protein
MIDDLALARAIHVLAVAHWIGGIAIVTTIVLPQSRLLTDANAAIASLKRSNGRLRGRRAFQSRWPAFPAFTCCGGWRPGSVSKRLHFGGCTSW